MTAATVSIASGRREGARYPRPHVGGVAHALAKRLGCSPKAASHRLERTRSLLPQIITAAREADREDWLRWFFGELDALRLGARLSFEPWMLLAMAGKDCTEDQRLLALLATPEDIEARAAWVKSLEEEIVAKQEVLAAVKGAMQ